MVIDLWIVLEKLYYMKSLFCIKKNVIFTFKSKLMHIILVYTTTVRTYFLFYHNINLYDSERNLRIWVGSASFGLK